MEPKKKKLTFEDSYTAEGDLKPGTHVVAYVPSGWLIAGTVDRVIGDWTFLVDGIYIESPKPDRDSFGGVANALDPSDVLQASWPLAPFARFRTDQLVIVLPAISDFKKLASQGVSKTIKDAAGR